ncbi:hypothetical protein LWI28_015901 [Acer negundo]|uniref:Uncharacterized protein n=1 Tax=Acer negundo TaxID=4023 RepID=A0AAD5IFA7_ACENE|nr:hypothetical protein LWI28_015901 [Acer negundo]
MPIQNSFSGASLHVELSWREDSRFSPSTVKIEEPHKGGPFGRLVSSVNAGLMSRKCRKDFILEKNFLQELKEARTAGCRTIAEANRYLELKRRKEAEEASRRASKVFMASERPAGTY